MKKKYPEDYYVNRYSMNEYAHKLVEENQIDKAIRLYKICMYEYPSFITVYDDLAEAYLKKGETKQAIDIIKKSMEVNRKSYPWEKESFAENAKKLEELENE